MKYNNFNQFLFHKEPIGLVKESYIPKPFDYRKWKSLSHVWLFATSWSIQSMEFSRPEYGVGSLSLFQGIFPTQGSNPGLRHCGWILYQLSYKGIPRILQWVACPFSSGSSHPRNPTGVSCITGRFFTNELSGKPFEYRQRYK